MTYPSMKPSEYTSDQNVHAFSAYCVFGAAVLTSYKGKGFTLTRTGVGTYSVVLAQPYLRFMRLPRVMFKKAISGDVLQAETTDISALGTTGTFEVKLVTPSTSAQPAVPAQTKYLEFPFSDAAGAGTAFTESVIYTNNSGASVTITHVKVTTPIAVAADNADYVSFVISKRTTGGAATVYSTANQDTRAANLGALAAFTPKLIAMTTTTLANGDSLTLIVNKAGAGQALTAATSVAVLQVLITESAAVAAVAAVAAAAADPADGDIATLDWAVSQDNENNSTGG